MTIGAFLFGWAIGYGTWLGAIAFVRWARR